MHFELLRRGPGLWLLFLHCQWADLHCLESRSLCQPGQQRHIQPARLELSASQPFDSLHESQSLGQCLRDLASGGLQLHWLWWCLLRYNDAGLVLPLGSPASRHHNVLCRCNRDLRGLHRPDLVRSAERLSAVRVVSRHYWHIHRRNGDSDCWNSGSQLSQPVLGRHCQHRVQSPDNRRSQCQHVSRGLRLRRYTEQSAVSGHCLLLDLDLDNCRWT